MKFATIILGLSMTQFCLADSKLLDVDPYSASSIESAYPEAVEIEKVPVTNSVRPFKTPGPQLKEMKTVNYEVLVPHLVHLVQTQQREIDRLKANK